MIPMPIRTAKELVRQAFSRCRFRCNIAIERVAILLVPFMRFILRPGLGDLESVAGVSSKVLSPVAQEWRVQILFLVLEAYIALSPAAPNQAAK